MRQNSVLRGLFALCLISFAAIGYAQTGNTVWRTFTTTNTWQTATGSAWNSTLNTWDLTVQSSNYSPNVTDGNPNPSGALIRPTQYRDDFSDVSSMKFHIINPGSNPINFAIQLFAANNYGTAVGPQYFTAAANSDTTYTYTKIPTLPQQQRGMVMQLQVLLTSGNTVGDILRIQQIMIGDVTNRRYWDFPGGILEGTNLGSSGSKAVVGNTGNYQSGLSTTTDTLYGTSTTLHFTLQNTTASTQVGFTFGNGYNDTTFTDYNYSTIDLSNYDTLSIRLKATASSGTPTQYIQFYLAGNSDASYAQQYTAKQSFTADGEYYVLVFPISTQKASYTTTQLRDLMCLGLKIDVPASGVTVTYDIDGIAASANGDLPYGASGQLTPVELSNFDAE